MFTEKTFRVWFNTHLSEEANDIANHGADAGYPYITYTSDTVKLFDQYGDDIWDMAVEQANDAGYNNVAEMIASFKRKDMIDSLDTFKNLMVWYACEVLAHEFENESVDE
jgi:hypothetical protein